MRRLNWMSGLLAAITLPLVAFFFWHAPYRITLTGWYLAGMVGLGILALVCGVLVAIALRTNSPIATVSAFVVGLVAGILGYAFFEHAHVVWTSALAGLAVMALYAATITAHLFTDRP